MRADGRLVLITLWLLLTCHAVQAVVHYTVSLADPVRHLVRVSMELPPGPDTDLQLPVWNALYQVRDFAQYMDSIRASDLAGDPIRLRQVNKGRWRMSGTAKGARIDYEMFVNDPGPYGAELNQQHAFLNLAEILVYADNTRYQESHVKFENVPQGWKVVAVQPRPAGEIAAANYDLLVDSPVEIGTFEESDFQGRCGTYRVVVDSGRAASILSRMVPPLEKIVDTATSWMNDCPFQTYTFIFHFSTDGDGGGMEHAYGTAITVSGEEIDNDLDPFTSVSAHEFFHLWNVKRIRPQSLEPIDYTRENYTTALWFSEGVDSAVSDLIRLKAGLLDEPRYLNRLSQGIRELQSRPAHLTQSVEQASLDAWLEKYPYFGLPERSISYYNKGELLGVLLDLRMRELTHGKQSLQTLFRWMNQNYAKRGTFFDDAEGVLNALQALTGADFHPFFADYVSGVIEIPWDTFFASVGLHVVTSDLINADPGFDAVQKFDRPPTIVRVRPEGDAERAGLKADDQLISINGAKPGRDFGQEIEKAGPGSTIHLAVRREGERLEFHWKLARRKVRIYELADLPSVTADQRRARLEWLSGTSTQ
jgi:predicted metalloprotease with PDZ domain